MCEIPSQTIVESKFYVDERKACLSEAGDIVQPINENLITKDHIYAEIGEVVSGMKKGRNPEDRITVFKSVGNAVQDIAAASLILENAAKLNIGTRNNFIKEYYAKRSPERNNGNVHHRNVGAFWFLYNDGNSCIVHG